MARREIINTFLKLDTDTSQNKQDNTSFYDGQNLRIVSDESLTNGALVNFKGTKAKINISGSGNKNSQIKGYAEVGDDLALLIYKDETGLVPYDEQFFQGGISNIGTVTPIADSGEDDNITTITNDLESNYFNFPNYASDVKTGKALLYVSNTPPEDNPIITYSTVAVGVFTNATLYFNGTTIPQAGGSYSVATGTTFIISGSAISGYSLNIYVDKNDGAGEKLFALPYTGFASTSSISVRVEVVQLTSQIIFAAYDNTKMEIRANGTTINHLGESITYPVGTSVSIQAEHPGNYEIEMYSSINGGSETMQYVSLNNPITIVTTTNNINVRFVAVEVGSSIVTNVVFSSYSTLNGGIFFNSQLVPQSGTTYVVNRDSVITISGYANSGYIPKVLVNKGFGAVDVALPHSTFASVGEILCTPMIIEAPVNSDKILTISYYEESAGTVTLKFNDELTEHPVSPAGQSFTLPHGTSFYLFVQGLDPTKTITFNIGGGQMFSQDYYEDTLTSNMNISVTFVDKTTPSNKKYITVSPYNSSRGSLYIYVPGKYSYTTTGAQATYEFDEGDRVWFDVNPLAGFELDTLVVDFLQVTVIDNAYAFYIYDDVSCSVTFKPSTVIEESYYGLTVNLFTDRATIKINGVDVGRNFYWNSYLENSVVTVQIVPDEGYHVLLINNVSQGYSTSNSAITVTMNMTTSLAVSLSANSEGTLYTRYIYYPLQ